MKNKLLLIILLFFFTTRLCLAQYPTLFGMTTAGGMNDKGIIFSYNMSSGIYSHLHDFGSNTDGQNPFGSLMEASNGILYGMTENGGALDSGMVFNYNVSAGMETDLYDFGVDQFIVYPKSTLTQASNDLLYGVAEHGLFSYNIFNNSYSNLGWAIANGYLIEVGDSLLCGMNAGQIFGYNISTGVTTIYHTFGSIPDGQFARGSLIQASNGLLYGMTTQGGTDAVGIIFSYNISTGSYTIVYDFGGSSDGWNPFGSLIQVTDSLLYGMTYDGGSSYPHGMIFCYNIFTDKETVLYDFGSGTDGKFPYGSLYKASDGLLYGMTFSGGVYNYGTIFNYDIITGTETDVHDFGSGTDGKNPHGDLIEIGDTLNVTPLKPSICEGSSVALVASGVTSYTWTPSTGLSATTGDSVIANPTTSTTYTIMGVKGSQIYVMTIPVTVIPNPIITINTPSPICNGENTTLSVSGGTTYTWTPSTGLSATTGDSVIANPSETTIYLVTAIGPGNCTTIGADTVKVTTAPPLTFVSPSTLFCNGLSAILKITGGGSGFVWNPATGLNTTTGDSVVANPTVSTTYTVTGIDSVGCASTGTEIVTIIPSPNKPTFRQHGDTLISSSIHDNQWYRNDTLLQNDTSQDLIIIITGNYWVVVNNEANGCSTTSDSMIVSGIQQLSLKNNQFSIYPNPTSWRFTIKLNGNQNGYTLEVYDVVGEKIYQSVLSNSQNSIDLSLQSAGLYFIYLKSEEGVEVGKVLISK